MRPSSEELRGVVAEVGFAVWQTQILEAAVGVYLVLVHKAAMAVARSEVEAMFTKVGKSTLGQLLREIQSTNNAPQHLIDQLDSFVQKRNWLVHHSRHESHSDMYSASRRSRLIARIAAIADEALALMKLFQAATETHLETLGMTKEQIDRDSAKLLKEWRTTA